MEQDVRELLDNSIKKFLELKLRIDELTKLQKTYRESVQLFMDSEKMSSYSNSAGSVTRVSTKRSSLDKKALEKDLGTIKFQEFISESTSDSFRIQSHESSERQKDAMEKILTEDQNP